MKIRTQLILAFLLLSIVPLSGIVLYSYYSSLNAVQRATEAEASALSREMNGRLASIKAELGRGVERIGNVPASDLVRAARSSRTPESAPVLDQVVKGFGEAAPFLRSIEFIPESPPARPAPAPAPEPAERPEKVEMERPERAEAPEPPEAPRPGIAQPPAPPVPGGGPAVVIDVSRILKEARDATEASGGSSEALQAIDTAMESLQGKDGQGPAAPTVTIPLPIPDTGEINREIRRRIEEEVAAEAGRREENAGRLEATDRRQETLDQERDARKKAEADRLVLGPDLEVAVWERGQRVGRVKAQVRADDVIWRVLERTRSEDEIPFALDAGGKLHTFNAEDRRKIEALPIVPAVHRDARSARWVLDDWAVATSKDPESGLVFGIARPVPLDDVREAAARNFGYGLGMIGLALLGILPISGRVTRNLKLVTDGADRIAHGDLDTRIPVQSSNEVGVLALTFNRMAEDLKRHREREIEQALLRTEYERKSHELEEARSFQLSLLPKNLPVHPGYEIAVSMRTATEVGGDYYDFHVGDDGSLLAAIGDATGHGARAGTMVTAVKSLFTAFAGKADKGGPRDLLSEAARTVKQMELGRMAMGLCLVRLQAGELTVSSAGMPPVLLFRAATGEVEEIALAGMPLGGLAFDYEERRGRVNAGDTLLLLSDGLPEQITEGGEPVGYPRVRALFGSLGGKSPEDVIAGLAAASEAWSGGQAPKDDTTFVVLRVR